MGEVDLTKRVLYVGRAKTASGTGRQIPLNDDLFEVLSMHAAWFTERVWRNETRVFPFPFRQAHTP